MEFPPRGRLFEIEEGAQFMPLFDAAGLNREALARTPETGLAHYYSRAQRALWKKGE